MTALPVRFPPTLRISGTRDFTPGPAIRSQELLQSTRNAAGTAQLRQTPAESTDGD